MATHRLKKFKGKIITVSGTVGKTSTKEAIFSVLNMRFKVHRSQKNMNTDFGMLLTILEIDSGYASVAKWSWLLLKGFYRCLTKNYHEVLLLELGIDKPKDMDFLTSVVKPDIAVLTNITPVHLAENQFKDLQNIFDEKRKMVDALDEKGIAILNTDNPYIANLARERKKKNTITYGQDVDSVYQIGKVVQSIEGITFELKKEEKKYQGFAKVLGEYQIYAITPAIICAELMGMSVEEALEAIKRYSLPPGRLNIVSGVNGSILLDSSYNSSPDSLKRALNVLKEIGKGMRRIAVLGMMNELGEKSKVLHEMIGEIIPQCVDLLVVLTGDAKYFAETAKENGLKDEQILSFKTSVEAAEYLKDKVDSSDLILVKGSQNNVRLEKFVKIMMANPEDAPKFLVRQGKVWEAKL